MKLRLPGEQTSRSSWVWRHMPVIQLLRRWRQEDHTLKACLGNLGPWVKQEMKGALGCSSVGGGRRPDEKDRSDNPT